MTLNTTKEFLRWLARSKRNKGGINYSKAITFGMPEGRGRKGEKSPRKKGKKKAETATSVVSPIADSIPTPPAESSQSNIQHPLPIHQPIFPRQSVQQSSSYNPHHTDPLFTFGSSLEEPINPTVFQQEVPPFSPYFQRLSSHVHTIKPVKPTPSTIETRNGLSNSKCWSVFHLFTEVLPGTNINVFWMW